MKKLIMFFVFVFISSYSFAQFSAYTRICGNKVTPYATVFGTKEINKSIGFTYFALVSQTWSEAYVGISYSPTSWASIGISVGIEQNPALYRLASSIWLGKGKTSFLLLTEKGKGADNYWYKGTLSYQVSNKIGLGLRAWRYNGVGPLINYKVPAIQSTLWAMPAYNFENSTRNFIMGIDISI